MSLFDDHMIVMLAFMLFCMKLQYRPVALTLAQNLKLQYLRMGDFFFFSDLVM